ncbi:MAG: sugar phosphate nucleotidyltransferase [Patescibacteria group bacterium]|mgnify:CR=1 FL=1
MQAVILAAGRGTRMGRLTETLPKPLLKVAGKTLLEHKFDVMPEEIDEIIIIVGYLADVIRDRFDDSYEGRKITYVMQENFVGGTMDALSKAQPFLTGIFLVMNGDNIYSGEDMKRCLRHAWATTVRKTESLGYGAKVVVDEEGNVLDIVEASYHTGGPGFENMSLYAFDTRLFEYPPVPKGPGSTEYGLPQTAVAASRISGIPFKIVESSFWVQIKEPADLAKAEELLSF